MFNRVLGFTVACSLSFIVLAHHAVLADQPPGGGNLVGHRGLLRTTAAHNQPAGLFSIGTDLQYYSASDLLQQDQKHSRMVNTYSVGWAPLSFLEVALAMHVTSDNDSHGDVQELQVAVGDPEVSLKGSYSFASGLALGGLFDLRFLSGAGFFEPAADAFHVNLLAVASWDGGTKLPLSVHINAGFSIDGSSKLFDDPNQLSEAQRFAAQLSSFNRVLARVGIEYATRYVGPFVELSLEPFVGAGAPGFSKSPGIVSFGSRIWPTKTRGLQLLAAMDIGVTGVGDGQPSILDAGEYAYVLPRWNLVLRLSYRFDPFAASRVTVVKADEKPTPKELPRAGTIHGKILDALAAKPIRNARIEIKGAKVSQLAVDASSGTFRSFEVQPGEHVLVVRADGYNSYRTKVVVQPGGQAKTTIRLTPRTAMVPGTLRGTVGAVGGRNVAGATILIPELDRTINVESDGSFNIELKPALYKIIVSARGYRAQRKTIRVREGTTVILNVELYKRK